MESNQGVFIGCVDLFIHERCLAGREKNVLLINQRSSELLKFGPCLTYVWEKLKGAVAWMRSNATVIFEIEFKPNKSYLVQSSSDFALTECLFFNNSINL